MIKLTACPICDSTKITPTHKINYQTHPSPHLEGLKDENFTYYSCHNCRALFLNPMYTLEYTEEIHKTNANAFVWQESYFDFVVENIDGGHADYSAVGREIERVIRKNSVTNPSILDIGSGTGSLLDLLRKQGFSDVSGIEPGPQGKFSAEKYNLNIFNIGITEFETTKKYDVILLMDVIEHIPDTHALITKIKQLLSPQGILIMNTPNLGSLAYLVKKDHWSALTPPAHLIMWHRKTFIALAKKYNFDVPVLKYISCGLLHALNGRLNDGLIKKTLQRLNQYFFDNYVSVPLSDSLFVVFKNK